MQTGASLAKLVNPFLGVDGIGNCLPGPYRPLGMVRLGPDIFYPQPTSGYRSGRPIVRFSHTHVAGTGGCSRYGNIGVVPFAAEPRQNAMPPFYTVPFGRTLDAIPRDEKAAVGYYSVRMMPFDILAELTCTRHVGVHRYTYPAGSPAWFIVDGGAVIQTGLGVAGHLRGVEEWDPEAGSIGGYMQVVGDREIHGRSDLRGGWGHDKPYSVYFWLRADRPFLECRLSNDHGIVPGGESAAVVGPSCQATLRVDGATPVNLQVGISFVSVANARASVDRETAGRDFDFIRAECEAEWERHFEQFRVSGGTEEQRAVFYSLLYRLLCMPTDLGVDEEGPHWKSGRRQFTDYYCLWDSIRNANSFFHLFMPQLSADMMNNLIDIAEHTGWLPDAHIAGHSAYMQSDCAADIMFSEAAAKGIEGVDYAAALRYMRKNNESPSPDVKTMGRYIDDYNGLGYLSTNVPKGCVSRHVEYSYHDWCTADLAERVGDGETARRYREHSQRLWNLWRQDLLCFGPRRPDGSWIEPFEPWKNPQEGWNDPYCYEGSPVIWSFNGMHDIRGLIERVGGNEAFIKHLDRVFEQGLFHVKETRMHVPHLYTYAGRPDRAAERVLESLAEFANTREGLPDNEDMGCQSGYFLWHSMGIYPFIGQTHYMLTPPLFDRVDAGVGTDGATLTITATREGKGRYIRSVTLNGERINGAWLEHDEIARGGKLHFDLVDHPTDFGKDQPPPMPVLK